jgi:glycosyltransferase involved in cell wall biosynthesis
VKPRILFVDHSGAPGGAELVLLDIAKHYRDTCKVVLLSDGAFRSMLEEAGVPVTVAPGSPALMSIRRGRSDPRELRALPAVVKLAWRIGRLAHEHDLIYANSQKAMIIAALAGRLAGKAIIWHLHDILSADQFGRTHRWAAARVANSCVRRVLAASEAAAEGFVAAGGAGSRVTVIHNGIDPGSFGLLSDQEQADLRASLGLERHPIVGSFGRFAPWKGQHVLIDALAALPGVHAMFVGTALFGEDAYADELRRRAEAMNLTDRVHFLGFRNDVPALMSLATVVAHTSVAPEPFGRVLVEGMLARRPVVASRAGGVLEVIEDGQSGILVPPADPTALASALAGLLNDKEEAARIAANGYKRARQHFSLDRMLGRIEQEVISMLAGEAAWATGSSPERRPHRALRSGGR